MDGTPVTHTIRPITNADWSRLEPLWITLYKHQETNGLLTKLPPDAYNLWVQSFTPVIDRFAVVLLAEDANELVGFFAGRLRSLPPYFGGHRIGHCSELFVDESHRRRGIAKKLLMAGIKWFRERDIHRVDLTVLPKNLEARDFYLRQGLIEELIQMTWIDEVDGVAGS